MEWTADRIQRPDLVEQPAGGGRPPEVAAGRGGGAGGGLQAAVLAGGAGTCTRQCSRAGCGAAGGRVATVPPRYSRVIRHNHCPPPFCPHLRKPRAGPAQIGRIDERAVRKTVQNKPRSCVFLQSRSKYLEGRGCC